MTSGGFAFDFNDAAPQDPIGARLNAANDRAEWDRRVAGLRETLRRSADSVFKELYPHGDANAREGRIGNVEGDHGESLKVDFVGEGAGLWRDHAEGTGGDLIGLYELFHRCTFPEAVEGLEGLVGISYAEPAREWVRRTRERATVQAKAAGPKPIKKRGPHWDYLSADGSRVLARVVRFEKFHALTGEAVGKTFGLVVLDAHGREVWEGPEVRPLYNLPAIVAANTVVLAEGEKCADALASLGVPATCIIGGANADLEKVDWAPLRGKRLILWGDHDAPGREFVRRLQSHLVGMPCAPVMVPEGKPEKWDAADCLAEGGEAEARALLGAAWALLDAMPAPANVSSRFRFVDVEDLEAQKPPEWLVDGMLPEAGYSAIVGDAGTMKSFAAQAWGLSIAHGVPWLGRATKQGVVAYVAGEGSTGVAGRVLAWREANGLSGVRAPFRILPEPVDMLGAEVDELLAEFATWPAPPVLVILDTLARCFGAGDENHQKDMNLFNGGVGRLQRATGAAVLVVHHTGKSGDVRGSTALRGAVDAMMTMDRAGARLVVGNGGKIGKMKEAEPFADVLLTYARVSFTRSDGSEGVSVVLVPGEGMDAPGEPDDDGPRRSLPGATRAIGPLEKAALKLVKQAGRPLGMNTFNATLKGSRPGIWKAVKRLADDGLLVVVHGEGDAVLYELPPEPGGPA
jgi:5S rRNA maturation endonuclease (ribonuclease M5)